ncbi:MAG: MFS transporter, partial [Burkholderiaceae bacterium]|nr:MFS transporter [Microbacteriaceae bacterium]
ARHLDRANGRVSAAQLGADEFVGPPLGGVLVALGTALPLLASGALYAGAALFFLALPRRSRAAAREAGAERMLSAPISAFSMVIEGAGWLRGHRLLGGLAIVGGLASVAYAAPFAVLVLVATERLGLDAAGYGVLLAVSALGGLVGSFVTARLRGRWGYRRTIVGSVVLGAGTMAALAGVTVPWVAAVLLAGYIGHAVVWGICVSSLRQRLVPDRLRGRVNASSKLVSLAGLTLGALLGGTLASGVGLAAPFALAAVLFAGCAVAVRALLRPDS